MAKVQVWLRRRLNAEWAAHSLRTAVAALVSLLVAGLLRLPETYWAGITTIIVMQSTLGAALTPSWQRFRGTALGAATGALVVPYFGASVWVFGGGVFLLGPICALLGLERPSYRFAGITLAIVMLAAHGQRAWILALDRFAEVTLGILMGLVLTAIWPQSEGAAG
jgi:uncharacterized membrane protein YgaE (UPF0421/DUF939 family)